MRPALEPFCDDVLEQVPAAESAVDDVALLCVELVGGGAQSTHPKPLRAAGSETDVGR